MAALEAGIPLDSTWDATSPQQFTSADWPGQWTVHNSGDPDREPTQLGDALIATVETVFAAVGVETGHEAVIDSAFRLGAEIRGHELAAPPVAVAIGARNLNTARGFSLCASCLLISK